MGLRRLRPRPCAGGLPATSLRPRRHCAGLSLIELMVALAIGLFIVAVATVLLSAQLREARAVAREVRLMQDLRTAADMMTRDLRRAGYWGRAAAAVWQPGHGAVLPTNPYGASNTTAPDGVGLRYSRDAVENDVVDGNEQFGYRLRAGVLELQLGAGNWQALTDPATTTVTALTLASTLQETGLEGSCMATCGAPGATCPPRQQVQRIAFTITARSASDPRVVRTLGSSVRTRNDAVSGNCPGV